MASTTPVPPDVTRSSDTTATARTLAAQLLKRPVCAALLALSVAILLAPLLLRRRLPESSGE